MFVFFFNITVCSWHFFVFFFNDTATTEIYTLSLHDALPLSTWRPCHRERAHAQGPSALRSEEHTSELQSHSDLVCRLLLEKKKKIHNSPDTPKKTIKPPNPPTQHRHH